MSRQAEQLWQRIIAKGTSVDPSFEAALHLQPGATEADFRSVENELGVILPEEMKALYRIHDGQIWDIGGAAFVRNLTLTPLAQVTENWSFLQEEFEPDELEPDIDYEIKPLLWNAKWIPIAENGGGDYLCLDTDPASSGNVGQVLYFWHDWGKRSVEAPGLFAFLELCIEEEDDD